MLYHRTRIFQQISSDSVFHGSLLHWAWHFLNTDISQGSVATCFRRGGIFRYKFSCEFVTEFQREKILKMVSIWFTYCESMVALFFYQGRCRWVRGKIDEQIVWLLLVVGCCQGELRWVEENSHKSGDCYYLFELDHEAACMPQWPTGLSTGSIVCIVYVCVSCSVAVYDESFPFILQ